MHLAVALQLYFKYIGSSQMKVLLNYASYGLTGNNTISSTLNSCTKNVACPAYTICFNKRVNVTVQLSKSVMVNICQRIVMLFAHYPYNLFSNIRAKNWLLSCHKLEFPNQV